MTDRESFAVALVGATDAGWLVVASSATEARETVHRAVPRLADVWKSELMVWTERRYRELYLIDQPFPSTWTRL